MVREYTEGTWNYIKNSANPEKLETVLELALDEMEKIDSHPDSTQIEVLANHLSEMLDRSAKSENLPELDQSMFSEIPKDSVNAAEKVVTAIGNLDSQEKYVLAVHFEVAKFN